MFVFRMMLILTITTTSSTIFQHTFESFNYPEHYIRHQSSDLYIHTDDGTELFARDSAFKLVPALNGDTDCFSFQSVNYPSRYIRHENSRVKITDIDYHNQDDASWKKHPALNGQDGYYSFETSNFPGSYLKHWDYQIWIGSSDGTRLFDDDASFTFNPVLEGCTEWTNFEWKQQSQSDVPFPSELTQITIEYNNQGPIVQEPGNIAQEKCEEASFEVTEETHWDVNVEISTSVRVIGQNVDVSVSASVGGSQSKTEGTIESSCDSFDFALATCPARYACTRTINLMEIERKTADFTATLVCANGLELPYEGRMTIDGDFQVSFQDIQDEFMPQNCEYYTIDYDDRSKQPYCDHCSSVDVCDSCEPDYYLIQNGDRRECINYAGCLHDCEGTPNQDTENELQCNDATTDASACITHLNTAIKTHLNTAIKTHLNTAIITPDPCTEGWAQVSGSLKQISVGFDGAVWGVQSDGDIYYRDLNNNRWVRVSGTLNYISVGNSNTVWGVQSDGDIYYRDFSNNRWVRVSGGLKQISAANDGSVWGVAASNNIYYRDFDNNKWVRVSGELSQISVGNSNTVWGVQSDGDIFYRDFSNNRWVRVSGGLKYINVDYDGNVYGVGLSNSNNIYYRDFMNNKWVKVHEGLKQVDAGNNMLWGVGSDDTIWQSTICLGSVDGFDFNNVFNKIVMIGMILLILVFTGNIYIMWRRIKRNDSKYAYKSVKYESDTDVNVVF